MYDAPRVIVFDVNETLSDMTALSTRFTDVGVPARVAQLWFSSVLREGFALTVVDASQPFATIGREVLRDLLDETTLSRSMDEAIEHILSAFTGLPVHPDVIGGVHALREAGLRLVTLSNGAAHVAENLLDAAGIRGEFEHVLSVEDAGAWKPDRRAYQYAARVCDTELARMMMVAVHPWDIDGAARAAMSTAWVNRADRHYPSYAAPPTVTVTGLQGLPDTLAARGLWRCAED